MKRKRNLIFCSHSSCSGIHGMVGQRQNPPPTCFLLHLDCSASSVRGERLFCHTQMGTHPWCWLRKVLPLFSAGSPPLAMKGTPSLGPAPPICRNRKVAGLHSLCKLRWMRIFWLQKETSGGNCPEHRI